MTPAPPSLQDASEALKAVEAQDAFWKEHYPRLLQEYPEQFVAVLNEKVVAASPDLQLLIQALRHQGLSPTDVWLRFVTTGSHLLML